MAEIYEHVEAMRTFYNVSLKEIEMIVARNSNLVEDVILPVRPDYEDDPTLLHTSYAALAMRIHVLAMIASKDESLRKLSIKEFNTIADEMETKLKVSLVPRPDPENPKSFRKLKLLI